jgi:hypothetical protein
MGEVIWLRERKPKTLLYRGRLLTPSEGQPMSKGEVIFTRICVVIILACAGYFTFLFIHTPLP